MHFDVENTGICFEFEKIAIYMNVDDICTLGFERSNESFM